MGRAIAAVVIGYFSMFVAVFALLTAAWSVLGSEGAFEPGSYQISAAWIGVGIAVGLLAGVLGGLVCASIGRSSGPPRALAALVLVLGIVFAVPVATAGPEQDPGPRNGEVSMFDAMGKAQPPVWLAFLNPVLGIAGILIGMRLHRRPS